MARPKSRRNTVNFRADLDEEVWELLEDFCAKSGRTRTAVVQSAIVEHVQQPVRDFPPLLEDIAKRSAHGRTSLENDPEKLSRRPKKGRATRKDHP